MDGRVAIEADDTGAESAVLTLPNLVTAIRLALIPVYLWLVFAEHRYLPAAYLLAALGCTDWIDGQLARRLHQVSALGKVLDPVADRLLVLSAVISVAWVGAVPIWFAVATLAREVIVSVVVVVLASMGAKRIDVLFIGKMGTFALMMSYPAFLGGYGTATWQEYMRGFAWITGIFGLICAWAALFSYVAPAREALRAGRAARAASSAS
jgi:cardiolipin synthase